MQPIKVVIEKPISDKPNVGEKSGKITKKLEPLIVDLPELLGELQKAASQTIQTKSKLTVQLQAGLSLHEEASGKVEAGIPVLKFGVGGKGAENQSGSITLTLETEIEPDK